jgi:hypothetical protein
VFASALLDVSRAGKVSIGIYKDLNFHGFAPEVDTLILSSYLLLLLKISDDGKA